MRVLYVTTVGLTMGFFKAFVKELLDEGHTVDIATNESEYSVADCYREWGCKIYPISCSRSPFKIGNLKAVTEIKKIVRDGGYEIVHCHTPIAAACTRVACKGLRKKGVKVIYTAHGFHFFKGAPKKNWMFYYPIEKMCAKWTDVLITINKEDYDLAKRKLRAKKIEFVPGVGIDVNKFANTVVDKNQKRKEIGVPEDAFMLLSVGELNENKNHQIVIRAIAELNDTSIHYVIAGKGDQKEVLETLANRLGVKLHLLGYRTDISELYKAADVYLLPSIREGLNVSIMEAMNSGLPCIVSNIRGNTDLIDQNGGFAVDLRSSSDFAKAIKLVTDFDDLRSSMKHNNIKKGQSFDVGLINRKMKEIYLDVAK